MLWFLVIGLFAWVGFLTLRISDLRGRMQWLERRVVDLRERLEGEGQDAPAHWAEPATAQPSPAMKPQFQELVDVPPASAARRPEEPLLRATEPRPSSRPAPTRPDGPPPRKVLRIWLEENGLAWAGGAALALGGLFLVTYAAQRGVFTPPFRIAAAVITGIVLLAASEGLRRRSGHALAAALTAGAGAATFYGAAWASHNLYGLIGVVPAAAMLAMTCFGLLALAFRHGEPLALLGLVGGFAAPAVTGLDSWASIGLSVYLAALTATGFGVAAIRGWGRSGIAVIAGTSCWGLLALFAAGSVRAALLAVAPLALACAVTAWRRRVGAPEAGSFGLLTPVALLAGCGLMALLWLFYPYQPYPAHQGVAPGALGTMAMLGLAALAVRRELTPAPFQLAAYGVAVASTLLAWNQIPAIGIQLWLGAIALTVVGSGLACAFGKDDGDSRWAGAAPATALLLGGSMAGLPPLFSWAPEGVVAAGLLAAAAILARASADPRCSMTPAIWIWTSGAAALAALNEAIDPRFLPAALAGFASAVALLFLRLQWRGFAAVILAASLSALAALVSPLMFEALRADGLPWPAFAALVAASGGMIFAAARTTRRIDGARSSAEALSTGALIVLLAGGFLLLRPWGPSGGMDPFLESSLRTVLILVAGLTAALSTPVEANEAAGGERKVLPAFLEEAYGAMAGAGQPGVIGRWRGQALLVLGLTHAVIFQLLVFNPLWAWWSPPVVGPPILDSLAVGFLAPAILLAAATVGRVSLTRRLLAAFGLSSAILAFTWQVLEVRRLFQGPTLHAGIDALGRAEMAVYAVLFILSAASTIWFADLAARRRLTVSPFAAEIALAGRAGAWVALAFAMLVFGFAASPWWGPIDRPLEGVGVAGLLLGTYAVGGVAPLLLALRSPAPVDLPLVRVLRLGGVAILFAFVNVVVRLAFRGYDMRPDLREASLETWTFSAVWGLFGFGLLIYGAARRSGDLRGAGLAVLAITLAKIFLFDMSRLDGVVRAGSFLAVGALLLTAAVLVRRLSGAGDVPFGLGRRPAVSEAES